MEKPVTVPAKQSPGSEIPPQGEEASKQRALSLLPKELTSFTAQCDVHANGTLQSGGLRGRSAGVPQASSPEEDQGVAYLGEASCGQNKYHTLTLETNPSKKPEGDWICLEWNLCPVMVENNKQLAGN